MATRRKYSESALSDCYAGTTIDIDGETYVVARVTGRRFIPNARRESYVHMECGACFAVDRRGIGPQRPAQAGDDLECWTRMGTWERNLSVRVVSHREPSREELRGLGYHWVGRQTASIATDLRMHIDAVRAAIQRIADHLMSLDSDIEILEIDGAWVSS